MPTRVRAGQNRIEFVYPEQFDTPLMVLTEGDNYELPAIGTKVKLEGRAWTVADHVHEYTMTKRGMVDASLQVIQVILRDPLPAAE
jgi:hypothetical protein